MIVAHRGASKKAPENTIPAFTLAWKQGADAVEGDFHLTADGHIVCIHDKDTRRVADRKLVVAESSLEDLRKLKVKDTVIPTIAEVFATVPAGKTIYIEVKCGEAIIPPLLEEIEKSKLKKEQVTVISFHTKVLAALKERAPQYRALWLTAFRKDKSGKITPTIEKALETLDTIKANGLSSAKDVVTREIIEKVQKKGYEYHVWTVDDVKTARRFREWGAKSITTNVPDRIRKGLAPPPAP